MNQEERAARRGEHDDDPGESSTTMNQDEVTRAAGPVSGGAPVLIGLTGPIGCGKSTIGGMLGELGGTVIDADALARDVTAPGQPALAAVRARFGDGVFESSGVLDRAALGEVVFSDPQALRDLEAIVHPGVRTLVEERLEQAHREGDPFVVVEAIKLVEGGLAERCDEVWLIECPAEVQQRRLAGRGMDADDIERRLEVQGDLADQLAQHAQRRIDTSGSLESIRECVEDALADVLAPRFAGPLLGPVERR
jgi:dephospho-CoA kinase